MIKRILLLSTVVLHTQIIYSQVGIGTTSPDESAVLDVSSTTHGLLPPRMTETERDAIVNPAKGLTVFNLTEDCLQINLGTSSSPEWTCFSEGVIGDYILTNCDANGFEGDFYNGAALTSDNKFSATITNNSSGSVTVGFATTDLALSGVSGITVSSVSTTSETIASGFSVTVDYNLSGTPASTGTLTGTLSKFGINCIRDVNISNGSADFTLPQTLVVTSINDGSTDIQGIIDNSSNQLTIDIPYTNGIGSYDGFTGSYTSNNTGTGENGDVNNFRLTYPSGTFSTSGNITATIEVDGDGNFNAAKQLFGNVDTVVSLDFEMNGSSMGNININAVGGIIDRNFDNSNHKFIYVPILAADGNTWLNNNLGANYSNLNHPQFNPSQQALSNIDYHAYGSSFQWGRYSDGHELIDYSNGTTTGTGVTQITNTLSNSDIVGHDMYIEGVNYNSYPLDWRSPRNDNLWQGESGINNPCPDGYRLPTELEIQNLLSLESVVDTVSALSSSLVLPPAGGRGSNVFNTNVSGGITGAYWTSTIDDFGGTNYYSRYVRINSSSVTYRLGRRMESKSVRCIKD